MFTLLIEDNVQLAQTVTRYLSHEDIACTLRTDGITGYQEAIDKPYDVIILDIELPGMDGIEICRRLRAEGKTTPILMLTSRAGQEDIIHGLDYGADDYLTKPCDYRELVARIRALDRRQHSQKGTESLVVGNISIDLIQKQVFYKNESIDLSKREFELLLYFAHHATQTITKQELAEKVWGIYDLFADQKVVEVYIGYLRRKIYTGIIETKKGFGYIFTGE